MNCIRSNWVARSLVPLAPLVPLTADHSMLYENVECRVLDAIPGTHGTYGTFGTPYS
ncbi:MAG: hypothetical protein KDC80_22705 [Saprospiraceae bacterium]|nr:hypothetical protein [Saprospiraceae bacterium]